MDDDSGEKVVSMHVNRPKAGIKDIVTLGPKAPSPADIGKATPPYGRDGAGYRPDGPETAPEEEKPDYQPPPKKSDPLPRPGDPYRPHAGFLNRLHGEQRLIHIVDKDCWSQGFAYSDLRRVGWGPPVEPGGGPVLVLRFVEAETTEVVIEGRNLGDVRYWIGDGRMPWVWEQPRGFSTRDDAAVVITRITLRAVEKEAGRQQDAAAG